MSKKCFLKQYIYIFVCLVFISLAFANIAFAKTSDQRLSKLRQQFAVNYLSPETHFALARYYLEKGNKVQAFYIMEYARRYRFSREKFDSAYIKYFGDNSPEPSDKAKMEFEGAYKYLKEGYNLGAEKSFVKAAELAPKSAMIQSWVGRFYLKVKKDEGKAMEYYFQAYFLDPHVYDTEYAESRIYKITNKFADDQFEKMIRSGKTAAEVTKDENPLIILRAIGKMDEAWKSEYSKVLIKYLDNDDSIVRWAAFKKLQENSGLSSGELISKLLSDGDLRKKGLVAYAIIGQGEKKNFKMLSKMITSNAELIRFDVISALAIGGGENGLEILKTHRKVETNTYLNKLMDKVLKEK